MALDGIYLSLVKKELEPLVGGRVDKIYQPSREELVFSFRLRGGSKRLLINSAAGTARVHLTNFEIENPKTPPMFCMLMRKHLSAGKLNGIRQNGFERILYFDFDSANEMGDIVRLTLAVEIMGRRSNIILLDSENIIIDSIKRVTPDMSAVRPVLPGMDYTFPPCDERIRLTSFDAEKLLEMLRDYPKKKMSSALVHSLEGISPVFADEILYESGCQDKPVEDYTGIELERICGLLEQSSKKLKNGEHCFVMLRTQEGVLKDFCFADIKHFGTLMTKEYCDSACELLDMFYSNRDTQERIKQKAQDLFRLLTSLSERTARRVSNQRLELEECAQRDKFRIFGDLIMANLYQIGKGMTELKTENLFDESLPLVTIPLDSRLTPSENAQKYYKEYKKMDTAEKKLTALIEQGEQEKVYIASVLDALNRADSEADISALREELYEQGYIKRKSAKNKAVKSLPPIRFVSDDGFTILVGRHNKQNDMLTLKTAQKTDLWFHTLGITGSHTVISCEGKTPPQSTIEQAARIAAYHSNGRQSSQVPVDYTLIKYVKKPNGAKPGMVIYTNQKTLYVKPDEQEIRRLRSK
ncbi:MAG: NFACT family protein [Ruminococcus sp.]|nr:NFACT family protein [Ruminococcus sp.]